MDPFCGTGNTDNTSHIRLKSMSLPPILFIFARMSKLGSTGIAALATGNYFVGIDWDKDVTVRHQMWLLLHIAH